MDNDIKLRYATPDDAAELLAIYAPYVEHTAITFEYEVPSLEEFRGRIASIQKRYPYIVAESDGHIKGYAYASAFHERAAYDWAVEISIYVEEHSRKAGLGRTLYDAIERILKAMNIMNVNACIAYPKESDEYLTNNSVEFHKHMGYSLVGEFHECGYKFGRWYNMVWMEKHINEHAPNPTPVINVNELADRII